MEDIGTMGKANQTVDRPDHPGKGEANRPAAADQPIICKVSYRPMDTSRLLLAFLAFGAACTTLWAWILASSSTPQER